MVGIESECFVVYLSCVYIYVRLNIYYVELRTCYFVSPLQCLVPGISHAVQMKRSSACKVIVEVLVLGLLVVVYKIPYSSIFTRGIIPTFAR